MTRKWFVTQEEVHVKHIVVDEAQNFRVACDEVNWFKKAKQIVKISNGELWVFLDYFQSYHNSVTGLPHYKSQSKHILSKVVRSPQLIYDKILEKMNEFASGNQSFLKEVINKCNCCHGINGFFEIKTMLQVNIVKYVSQKCEKYLSDGYKQSDIAILCSTKPAAEHYRSLLHNEISRLGRKKRVMVNQFTDAENIIQDAIIIDSVRRFAGLERIIVFAVNPVCDLSMFNVNLFICAASRATGNVHLIYEKLD